MSLALFLVLPARAELPLPTYPECGEEDQPELCPDDFGTDWELLSWIPENARDSIREAERDLGSGMSLDRALRTTAGNWEALVAIGDSGIEWDSTKYVNKIYLNVGELPPPQDADGNELDYDADGNGLVNIQDYADDPRVDPTAGRDAADHMLDPSDLIYTFSDGIDDDGNGYVDDIAGWDFFGRDNDAYSDYTEGYGTHGDGVIKEAAAEGGNGDGDIGVCPNCAVLPIRIGDTFISDGSRAAEGILFAADSGAVVISLASGALSNPELATAAVAYAYDHGLSVVGAAGDENAYHHNFPAVLDNVHYVHSVRYDTPGGGDPVYSYMNTWNCNNYGARITTVAPSGACATGSVAVTSGLIGMIHSAAQDAGLSLTPGEVYQVVIHAVDDVNLSAEELDISNAYPSSEGWDPFYGYGRVNIAKAVQMVADGEIPPVASIDGPEWFEYVDVEQGSLDVVGRVSADRASGYSWELLYGTGHDPQDWTSIGSGQGSDAFEGVLGTLDLSELDTVTMTEPSYDEGILERLERVNGPAVTLKLVVVDDDGLEGEQRKTFFAHYDPDLLSGFPFDLGASGESSPILVDLTGDGIFEIVIATTSGEVLAIKGDGTLLDGWPVVTEGIPDLHVDSESLSSGDLPTEDGQVVMATAAAGDLDGDGSPEVVVATIYGAVHAWHADGSPVDGFPVYSIGREPEEFDGWHTYDQGFAGAPTLEDLDGDGTLEIVAAGMDSRLYAWDHTGADWGPYPIEVCYSELCGSEGFRIITSPAIADVDGDGDMDIGLGTNEAANNGHDSVAYIFDAATAELLSGWPVLEGGLVNEAALLPLVGEGHPASLAYADLDGDGDMEVANAVMLGMTDLIHHDGSMALELTYVESDFGPGTNANLPSLVQMTNNPAFGDMDMDGVPDFVMGGAGALWLASLALSEHFDFQNGVAAWSGATGAFLPGWPRQIEDLQFLMAPSIADISGDGMPEAIYGSAGYVLYAWDAEGNSPSGWPKFTGHWLLGSPAVGDIDGDGYLDVVVSTREGALFAWQTNGSACQDVQWQSLHHDARNTGNYHTALMAQEGPEEVELKGCCKRRAARKADAAFLLPLGLLIGLRRRRLA